jgi:hypothetical protein
MGQGGDMNAVRETDGWVKGSQPWGTAETDS